MEHKQVLLVEAQRLEDAVSRSRKAAVARLNGVLAGNPFIRFHKRSCVEEYRQFLHQLLQGVASRRLIDCMVRRIDPPGSDEHCQSGRRGTAQPHPGMRHQ